MGKGRTTIGPLLVPVPFEYARTGRIPANDAGFGSLKTRGQLSPIPRISRELQGFVAIVGVD